VIDSKVQLASASHSSSGFNLDNVSDRSRASRESNNASYLDILYDVKVHRIIDCIGRGTQILS
jgi:hypothetical protein